MGWEPITYCRECGEAFDVYQAPEDRVCDCCKEFFEDMELEKAKALVAARRLGKEEVKHEPR